MIARILVRIPLKNDMRIPEDPSKIGKRIPEDPSMSSNRDTR
jgi:hypothetical protein